MIDLWLPPKPAIIIPQPKKIVCARDPRFVIPAVLPGITPIIMAGRAVTITFTDSVADASDLTTYTFSGRSLGVAAPDRTIVVGAVGAGAAARTVSSVTVAGISATIQVQEGSATGATTCLATALVPTGTTGDIVVTFSGGVVRAAIGIWRARDANVIVDTGTSTADPSTDTININAGGAVFGAAITNAASSYSWTNLTELYDQDIDGGTRGSFASEMFPTQQSLLSITADPVVTIAPSSLSLLSIGP